MAESKYSPELIESICAAVADGKSVAAACKLNGISRSVFYKWAKINVDIIDTLKKAIEDRLQLIGDVAEVSLLKRVRGEKYTETKIEEYFDQLGNPVKKTTTTTKYIPPSDTAIIFALANATDRYKRTDKQETVKESIQDYSSELTDEQVQAIADKIQGNEQCTT